MAHAHAQSLLGAVMTPALVITPQALRERGKVIGRGVHIYIGECGSTLYVGLSRIVRNLIQKSTV